MRPGAFLTLACVFLATSALHAADTEASLLDEMDKHVAEIVDDLRDLETKSDTTQIKSAAKRAQAISSLLADLRKLGPKGTLGKEAESRLFDWPIVLREFGEATDALVLLKAGQAVGKAAPAQCAQMGGDKGLGKLIKETKANPSVDGPDDLKAEGKRIGPPVKRTLDDYDKKLEELEHHASDASEFRVADKWGDIRTVARDSATQILRHVRKANVAAHSACDRLAMGVDNPDIKDAIRYIEDALGGYQRGFARAKADVDRWNAQVKDLRKWHDAGEGLIRDALCKAEEDEDEDEIVTRVVDEVSNRVRVKLQKAATTLEAESGQILRDLASPQVRVGNEVEAKKLAAEVRRLRRSIARQTKHGVFLGAANPKLRARMEIGKKEHVKLQRGCISEVTLPGKRMRLDCVAVSSGTCVIIEIKPDTPPSTAKGNRRLREYRDAVLDLWADDPAEFQSGKMKEFQKCVDAKTKQLKVRTLLKTYKFCDRKLDLGDFDD